MAQFSHLRGGMTSVDPTPLVDVLSATPPVSVAEAIAVVRHVSRVPHIGAPGPWPSLDRVLLAPDGHIDIVTGTSTARANSAVTWLGNILYALVASADDGHHELPRGLSLVVTRATGSTYDDPDQVADVRAFPPYSSVQNLLDALDRYALPDDGAAVAALAERCATRGASPETAPGGRPREGLPSGPPSRDVPQAELLIFPEESPGASPPSSRTFADLARLREDHGIGIAQISTDTRLSARLIEELERGDLSRWPRGLFARSYLTAYARAIGVEPAEVLGLADPAVVRDEGIEPVRELRQRQKGKRLPRLPISAAGSFGPMWRAAAVAAILLALGAVVMPRVQSGAEITRLQQVNRDRQGKDISVGSTEMSEKQRSVAVPASGDTPRAADAVDRQSTGDALAAISSRIRHLQRELDTLEGRLDEQGHESGTVRARIDEIDTLLLGLDARRRRLRAELGAIDRGIAASTPRRDPQLPQR